MADNNTKTLRELLGLTKSSHSALYENTRDDLLITIDCENGFEFTKQDHALAKVNSQLGLAILDPKDLSNSTSVSTRFIFGESYNLFTRKKDLAEKIDSIIPDSRNVILIGHGRRQDLKAFSSLNAKFLQYPFFDTQIIARNVLPVIDENKKTNESLRDLLTCFNCPFDRLHCAGNDANFTLRLLLLLVVYSLKDVPPPYIQEFKGKVKIIKDIAYAAVPALKPYPHDVAFVRKQRRRQLKLQARFQGPDTIARVRAERAKKRKEKLAALLREICTE
ncbi:hypothetical protein TWF788_005690 [Orbilia oligospora]|uniref:Gfd2/YDR514C-like C-terminal domain-containing protein n=1 Tax=Orbilia oligospora TaxID=2813651 RepID=A0A7C8TZA8_ORBOL|nr:hypothetical protein TWF788_005690 [Orbilia oligospora]